MASNINPYNIDGTFPVAGQDNPSQGFRDNFNNTKNNFLFASNEISDLQSKVLVTAALDGQSINNDMAGTQIIRPQLSAWTQTLYDLGIVGVSATLDFNQANFQKMTPAVSTAINFINWPSSIGTGALGYGLMRVWIVIEDSSYTITLPSTVTIGVKDIAGYNPATRTISFDSPGNYIFDFSSIDSGNNYLIFDATRNRSTFRDPSLYLNNVDAISPTLLVGYGAGLSAALALEQGQDTISALGSYNSVAVGTLSLANIAYTQMDTGGIGGYSTSAARGNIQVGNIQPVLNRDLVGYVNSIAYTGTGSGNAFQQVASIDFFATGNSSQISYANGLGGNIAFFTAADGSIGLNRVTQAVGIENDQSVNFFGNINAALNMTIGGNLTVTGTTKFVNTETVLGIEVVAGNLVANSGAVSTNQTTGALVVNGGAGISGTLNVSSIGAGSILTDSHFFANGKSIIYTDANVTAYINQGITTTANITVGNILPTSGVIYSDGSKQKSIKWTQVESFTFGAGASPATVTPVHTIDYYTTNYNELLVKFVGGVSTEPITTMVIALPAGAGVYQTGIPYGGTGSPNTIAWASTSVASWIITYGYPVLESGVSVIVYAR